jgi:hypothetical protein
VEARRSSGVTKVGILAGGRSERSVAGAPWTPHGRPCVSSPVMPGAFVPRAAPMPDIYFVMPPSRGRAIPPNPACARCRSSACARSTRSIAGALFGDDGRSVSFVEMVTLVEALRKRGVRGAAYLLMRCTNVRRRCRRLGFLGRKLKGRERGGVRGASLQGSSAARSLFAAASWLYPVTFRNEKEEARQRTSGGGSQPREGGSCGTRCREVHLASI